MLGKLTDRLGLTRTAGEDQGTSEEERMAPPTSSAASIVLNQHRAAHHATSPVGRSITSVIAPQKPATPEINQEVLDHFRTIANGSHIPGFRELAAQLDVLRKHIKDENALYAAALDTIAASGITKDAVLRAVDDRIKLVQAEVAGALSALDNDKAQKNAEREARVIQINGITEQLGKEIAERQSKVEDLNAERDSIREQLAAAGSEHEAQRHEVNQAAAVVLDELTSQLAKLRSV